MREIIGRKVVAIKVFPKDKDTQYILFDDEETYMMLIEQDYYAYHDCSSSAREVEVYQSKESWQFMMNTYPDLKEKKR